MIQFISDLHLSPGTPRAQRIFLDFLARRADGANRLYILGDLFEAWPGDDCLDTPEESFARELVAAIAALSNAGVAVSVMHGNRDFLLGEDFAARTGATLIPDPYTLSLPGRARSVVLSHGDRLCTDDTEYQQVRQLLRSPGWQRDFLGKPLKERQAITAQFRRQSEQAVREKQKDDPYLMDLNRPATETLMRQNGYATLIHGHTHHPAMHVHWPDGVRVERWVLADWHDERGESLAWDGEQLLRLPLV